MRKFLTGAAAIGTVAVSVLGLTALALASPSTPARSVPAARSAAPGLPRCAAATLAVWVSADHVAYDGNFYCRLEFTSTGGPACTLSGYPDVPGLSAAGKQVGSPAQWVSFAASRTVTIAPVEPGF
jgi:hypothetical protein